MPLLSRMNCTQPTSANIVRDVPANRDACLHDRRAVLVVGEDRLVALLANDDDALGRDAAVGELAPERRRQLETAADARREARPAM